MANSRLDYDHAIRKNTVFTILHLSTDQRPDLLSWPISPKSWDHLIEYQLCRLQKQNLPVRIKRIRYNSAKKTSLGEIIQTLKKSKYDF